jgi:hypothetical protein
MGTLQDWLDDARSRKTDDLIYYNYKFETDPANQLVPLDVVNALNNTWNAKVPLAKGPAIAPF